MGSSKGAAMDRSKTSLSFFLEGKEYRIHHLGEQPVFHTYFVNVRVILLFQRQICFTFVFRTKRERSGFLIRLLECTH